MVVVVVVSVYNMILTLTIVRFLSRDSLRTLRYTTKLLQQSKTYCEICEVDFFLLVWLHNHINQLN